MLGEVALEIGQQLTATELVPLLPPLVRDGESIIRQRLCGELKVLCLVLMGMTGSREPPNQQSQNRQHSKRTSSSSSSYSLPRIPRPNKSSKYYKVMVHHIFPHLYSLISDPDNEVRRAASENIVKLALRVDPEDVVALALSIPLRLVKEGQKRASNPPVAAMGGAAQNGPSAADASGAGDSNAAPKSAGSANNSGGGAANPQTPAEDLLITSSNLLADLSSFLPPPRLPPAIATRYLSPAVLSLADDPNFRVRRAAVQALPRTMGSATLDDARRRLLPKFVALSGDEMYRVRKASGECLVDVSRALGVLPWRAHFVDVWIDGDGADGRRADEDPEPDADPRSARFYRARTKKQIGELHNTLHECHEIRRRALCAIAKKLLEDTNKFVRYGMMQFLGPLIASFYPLDRGSMVGGMGGLLYGDDRDENDERKASKGGSARGGDRLGTLGIGVGGVDIAKCSTGLERAPFERRLSWSADTTTATTVERILSYNHSLQGLELILHGESPANRAVLGFGGGCDANRDPFGTMGPQFFPHANGMVGRSSALDDDDTDSFLLKAYAKRKAGQLSANNSAGDATDDPLHSSLRSSSSPRAMLPKFLLESRSDALALARIVSHRTGRVPDEPSQQRSRAQPSPYPPLMSGRPDPEDLKAIRTTLLIPFVAMASCRTGEDTTDAEMRVYCAYSLPAVILLFGGQNWERDGLKRCFLDLIGQRRGGANANGANDGAVGEGGSAEGGSGGAAGMDGTVANAQFAAGAPAGPPLPVKRCLASSVHAVAHMLGPDAASNDAQFLAAFERSFLRDPDEAIRLNVLKNLASFLGALPPGDGPGRRNSYLPALHSVIAGEDVLGAVGRRSASNPGVLNWRGRDAVARVLPDLIVLYDAGLNREYLWPVLRTLSTDSVSAVRENAGWSVPVLLRRYATANDDGGGNNERNMAWMMEVTVWLRETFLDNGGAMSGAGGNHRPVSSFRQLKKKTTSSEGAFSKRQGYCRILAAVALAMRMGEGSSLGSGHPGRDPLGCGGSEGPQNGAAPNVPIDPFGKMSQHERECFRAILLRDLLPPALEMAADCVANVRLTLTKCLKALPADVRKEGRVEEVLSTLEEELMTWDVGDMPLNDVNPGGIIGGSAVVGGGPSSSSSDPPEAKAAATAATTSIIMTSTMSAC